MLNVETRHAIHADHAKSMDTTALRKNFAAGNLFVEGDINLVYTHYERMVVGGAVPGTAKLTLDHVPQTGTPNFLERRELGVVNIGETGTVSADGDSWALNRGDVLYLGAGAGPVSFEGQGRYYLASAPAHKTFPNRLITLTDSEELKLGSPEASNQRMINQFIHPLVMESCQLVLGYTSLATGSVWNTMPAHTHDRRMEVYLYFDLEEEARIFHLMGEPTETRHLVLANEEAAISPPWSIHSAAGTSNYTFIWAMAGDNIDYKDMDFVQPAEIQ
jgi:4-deoxy-L-threo-5-hexosulose-uronate ketol-isomerase